MARHQAHTAAVAPTPPRQPEQAASGGQWLALLIGLVVAAVCVTTIWAEPRPIGDLFAALAVGRDVFDGKLGKPDDWAFTTSPPFTSQPRVAVNQNWGTHLVHYLTYRAGGDTALLVLKMAILVATAGFICLAARQRGVGWPVALVVAGGAIAGGRSYIDLRANLTTLMLAPLALCLLFKTRKNVRWIWAVMLINLVWANSHGGFIFGLGMMALWVIAWGGQRKLAIFMQHKWSASAIKAAVVELWPLPVALVGSVALATFANPYGPRNLVFPLTITDPAWTKLNEWQPLISDTPFGTAWEFGVAMGVLSLLLLLRVTGVPGVPASAPKLPSLQAAAMAVFDLVLAAVVIVMTFKARRFVPLAIIVVAPLVAVHVQWLLDSLGLSRRQWVVVIPGAALVLPLMLHAHRLWLYYDPDNPRHLPETFFGRMNGRDVQPVGLAQFVSANNIGGRVFNEWRWEGYLHWQCPQLKVFIGGRAHQVYEGATDQLGMAILTDPQRSLVAPSKILSDLDVHLVAIPSSTDRYGALVKHLAESPRATWAYVYYDGVNILLADTAWPGTQEIVRRTAAGELKYPDPATGAISRAMTLIAPVLKCPAEDALNAFVDAVRIKPYYIAYICITQLAAQKADGGRWLTDYFQQEFARLDNMGITSPDSIEILFCQVGIADTLAKSFEQQGDLQQHSLWRQKAAEVSDKANRMLAQWP